MAVILFITMYILSPGVLADDCVNGLIRYFDIPSEKQYIKLYKVARKLGTDRHHEAGQTYDDKPYTYHLRGVKNVLNRFNLTTRSSLLGLKANIAAWLHDIVEDTPTLLDEIYLKFGREIGDAVYGLTNYPKGTLNRGRRTKIKTRQFKVARIVKLADRIFNLENSLDNFQKGNFNCLLKYLKEDADFILYLKMDNEVEEMWVHYQNLINKGYALVREKG